MQTAISCLCTKGVGKRPVVELAGESSTHNSPAPKCVFQTGSINSCDGLIAAGTLNGRPCDLTIDTGSNISIIKTDFLTRDERANIQPVNSCLRTVTGEKAPIHGKGTLQVNTSSEHWKVNYVTSNVGSRYSRHLHFGLRLP